MRTASLDSPRRRSAAPPSPRVSRLERLGRAGRLAAYRAGKFTFAERSVWAARYPEEVPMVNGEVEWIGLTLADLD